MAPVTPPRPRAIKEHQLAIVKDPGNELQRIGDREIQLDEAWEQHLNRQVKIM
jgi:hypothetical protein